MFYLTDNVDDVLGRLNTSLAFRARNVVDCGLLCMRTNGCSAFVYKCQQTTGCDKYECVMAYSWPSLLTFFPQHSVQNEDCELAEPSLKRRQCYTFHVSCSTVSAPWIKGLGYIYLNWNKQCSVPPHKEPIRKEQKFILKLISTCMYILVFWYDDEESLNVCTYTFIFWQAALCRRHPIRPPIQPHSTPVH